MTRLLVNPGTVFPDLNGLAAMALLRRHKFVSTVPLVVRVDERGDPLASMVFAVEWVAPVIGPYFAVRKSNSE